MAPVLSKFFGYVFLLSLAGIAFAGEETKNSDDALEIARRDLESLPTTERSILPGDPLTATTIAVPTFTPLGSAGKPSAEENSKPASSEGWLLDALRKSDDQAQERKDREIKFRPNDSASTRRTEVQTSNPLRSFLDLWLSPQDKRLLTGEKSNPQLGEKGRSRRDESFRGETSFSGALATGDTQSLTFGTTTERVNPYLAGSALDQHLLPEPLAPLPIVPHKNAVNSPLIPFKDSAYSPQHDAGSSLENRKADETLPVPTAPLIDEHRYFPQLRRF